MPTKKSLQVTPTKRTRSKMHSSNTTKNAISGTPKSQSSSVRRISTRKLLESMTLNDLLEASKLSTQHLHGEKVTLSHSTPKAKMYYTAITKASSPTLTNHLINKMNSRIVELNTQKYTPSQQSRELYKKFMED